ncbi:hypothetical protein [Jiangella alba]|uniref:hypothetical protein n=1 Tax=Jiangella alba TaxID=561176 RepID=UPI001495BB89|nr:hypothetical protein [Jiangella alba]
MSLVALIHDVAPLDPRHCKEFDRAGALDQPGSGGRCKEFDRAGALDQPGS